MILKAFRIIWLLLMLLLVAWFGWYLVGVPIDNMIPRPLGNKLVYLGKQDYGGPFGDSDPASTYYYGTEMNSNEIQNYFKNAKYSGTEGQTIGGNYGLTVLDFTSPKGNFKINYYDNSNVFKALNIKHSHTISVESYDYSAANASTR